MNTPALLRGARRMCARLVDELFPKEAEIFDDAWGALFPIFEKWTKAGPPARRFAAADLAGVTGLRFGQALDLRMPIAVMALVATMIEMWEAGETVEENQVRASISKYVRGFGGDTELLMLLQKKAPAFCRSTFKEMATRKTPEQWEEERRKMAATGPQRGTIFEEVTRNGVREFEQDPRLEFEGVKRSDYAVWMDCTSNRLWIWGKEVEEITQTQSGFLLLLLLKFDRVVDYRSLYEPLHKPRPRKGRELIELADEKNRVQRWVMGLKEALPRLCDKYVKNVPGKGYRFADDGKVKFRVVRYSTNG